MADDAQPLGVARTGHVGVVEGEDLGEAHAFSDQQSHEHGGSRIARRRSVQTRNLRWCEGAGGAGGGDRLRPTAERVVGAQAELVGGVVERSQCGELAIDSGRADAVGLALAAVLGQVVGRCSIAAVRSSNQDRNALRSEA